MQIGMGASRQVRSIALRQYPYRDSNSAHRRCTSSAATALAMAMRSSTKVPQAKWNRGAEVATRPGSCFLLCICLVVGGLLVVLMVVFGCLRHAGGWLCFRGFWGVWFGRVCVGGGVGVSYSLAAGRRGSPRWGGSGWPSGGGLRTQERVCTTL